MRTPALLLALALLIGPALAADPAGPEKEIATLLATQSAAWNRGDLDAFCAVYADDATFVTPTGITHGRKAVLDRYRAKYRDKAGMGTLRLDLLETRALAGGAAASVVGRWTLTWPDKPEATGSTVLVLVETGGSWRIVQDASM